MKAEIRRDTPTPPQRFVLIDLWRGTAVLLMIVFHVAFDLNGFRFVSIDFSRNLFWYSLPRFVVFLFLTCVGLCLAMVHKAKIDWPSVGKRFFKIGGWALVVTVITYIFFPKNFVYFGILHCIAVASAVGVLFVHRPKLSLFLGLTLVVSDLIFDPKVIPLSRWLGVTPMDYIPFYPWFGVVLFGIYLESTDFHKIPVKMDWLTRPLAAMGRHSLKIYLLHRPIIFGMIFLLYKMKNTS